MIYEDTNDKNRTKSPSSAPWMVDALETCRMPWVAYLLLLLILGLISASMLFALLRTLGILVLIVIILVVVIIWFIGGMMRFLRARPNLRGTTAKEKLALVSVGCGVLSSAILVAIAQHHPGIIMAIFNAINLASQATILHATARRQAIEMGTILDARRVGRETFKEEGILMLLGEYADPLSSTKTTRAFSAPTMQEIAHYENVFYSMDVDIRAWEYFRFVVGFGWDCTGHV